MLQIFVEERKEEGMRKTGGWGGGQGEKWKERRRESRKEEKQEGSSPRTLENRLSFRREFGQADCNDLLDSAIIKGGF